MDARLLWGTLEMLILDVVSHAPTYGYAISQAVLDRSRGYFELKEGSLYPALHRLERQGLLRSSWAETDDARRRKYYRLTPAGRRMLAERRNEWEKFTGAVKGVLGHECEA